VALDALILAGFAALVFLLGVFPLKDVDFWWHLRTGDWIRANGMVPTQDLYTYTVPENAWVDLHWIFQVLLSLGFERGGVILLNVAKCVVTTAAVLLLVLARKKDWPLWAMVPAWIPALVLLGGRMYIRPETLTLLYLAVFLAVLFRIGKMPWLIFVLPATQVVWVNSQGLFVFGPVVLVMALIDYAIMPGRVEGDHKRWWKIVLAGSAMVGVACLVNPYGIVGALNPLALLATMRNPIFKNRIAELSSISRLIRETAGYPLLMLQVHLGTIVLAGLSFVVPMCWGVYDRVRNRKTPEVAEIRGKKGKKPKRAAKVVKPVSLWSLSLFRLLMFGVFTALSWQATRNSHQFAAVAGTVTAWNLGEWAAALERRRKEKTGEGFGAGPRVAAVALVAGMLAVVGSGTLYRWAEEGRTIGLGEEPAWFPHEAVKFAGTEGLPPRFLSIHIGHSALFIHQYGPERKVFVDPRLEVMKAEQFTRYDELSRALAENEPTWRRGLDLAERPVVLTDHQYSHRAGATLMADPDWECLWFGPVAAVFAHKNDAARAGLPPVDFLARHFGEQPRSEASTGPDALSAATGCRNYAITLIQERGNPTEAEPIALLGLDYARKARDLEPSSAEPWLLLTTLETGRGGVMMGPPVPRGLEPFDPLIDLSAARVAYYARQALERDGQNAVGLSTLSGLWSWKGMEEPALPLLERLAAIPARTPNQAAQMGKLMEDLAKARERLGKAPRVEVANGNEVRRSVRALLESGRAESAARVLAEQYPAGERDWATADQLATLLLHLGRPAEAREAWATAPEAPREGLKTARMAAAAYAGDDLDEAARLYKEAVAAAPDLMEAWYGRAMVELDAGREATSREAARKALELAADNQSKGKIMGLVRLLGD
jgi:tetratricopeptide (TPR) repeat protein